MNLNTIHSYSKNYINILLHFFFHLLLTNIKYVLHEQHIFTKKYMPKKRVVHFK